LTIVSQGDVGGLQVRQGERWVDVDPIPDALVVNIGDMMQVWSNDRFRSPVHRVVVNTEKERFSAPFFMNPSYAKDCAPLAELLAPGERPQYRPINWGEFRRLRAAGDYADVGEEVQISHYRIE
jgi:isopenicillin N synthase-like dioxygenase